MSAPTSIPNLPGTNRDPVPATAIREANDPRPSVVFLFPHVFGPTLEDIELGTAPSDRGYGFVELRDRGWRVGYSDHRHTGSWAQAFRRLRSFVSLVDPGTFRTMLRYDIVLVKDDFSLPLTILAKIFRRRVVYLDSMFDFPKRFWRRWSAWWNIRLAWRVVCYSNTQAQHWASQLGVSVDRFHVVPYGIDVAFYKSMVAPTEQYVLAVGRDLGRDFPTLLAALEGTGIGLKLVTLPYLLPSAARSLPWVEVLQRVSYGELFRLYAGALGAIVPLKADLTYPSGIRAAFEGTLLGTPVIVTRTPVMEECFSHGVDALLVPPGDSNALQEAILRLQGEPATVESLVAAARANVSSQYTMNCFVDALERILHPCER